MLHIAFRLSFRMLLEVFRYEHSPNYKSTNVPLTHLRLLNLTAHNDTTVPSD